MSSHLLTQTPCGRWQTDKIVKKCSATELIRAVEANINAQLPLMYTHMSDFEVIDEPDRLGISSCIPDPLLNSIYWASFPSVPERIRARIEEVLDRFKTLGCLPTTCIVSRAARPKKLGLYLEARRFVRVSRGLGMGADLMQWSSAGPPLPGGWPASRDCRGDCVWCRSALGSRVRRHRPGLTCL